MKKIGILLLALLLMSIFSIVLASAQTDLPGVSGGIDPETGLPTEFKKFQEVGDQLSEEEQRKAYLKQEWTKLLAKNKFFGPFLFYTDKFFTFFNPIWKIIFGMEFSWSWVFMFSLAIWITIIVLIYSPVKSFIKLNPFAVLAASIIISSLAGISGAIRHLVEMLVLLLTNPWYVWVALLFLVIFCYAYSKIIKKYGKQYKEKEAKHQTEKDREILHAHAQGSKKALDNARSRSKRP